MGLLSIPALIVLYALASPYSATQLTFNGLQYSMPEKCSGEYMCFDRHKDYPLDIIETILNETMGSFVYVPSVIEQRSEYYQNECEVKQYMEPLYEIIDEKGHMRFVVQSTNFFQQVIQIQKCRNPGRITSATPNIPQLLLDEQTINVTCVQCTIDYDFLVLSLDGKRLETARMKDGVPVCCSCVLERKETDDDYASTTTQLYQL